MNLYCLGVWGNWTLVVRPLKKLIFVCLLSKRSWTMLIDARTSGDDEETFCNNQTGEL